MHGVEAVRQVPQRPPAKRLNVRMPALAIGGERSQHSLRLLFELLLQLRALHGARASGVLQDLFSRVILLERIYHG